MFNSAWKVAWYFIDLQKSSNCEVCNKEKVQNVFVLSDKAGNTKNAGKECAKRITDQMQLVDEMYNEMQKTARNRFRFDIHPKHYGDQKILAKDVFGNVTSKRSRWMIKYQGFNTLVIETAKKDYMVWMNGEKLMNGNKPMYFKDKLQAIYWFYDYCAELRMRNILKKHNVTR